ncbi:MAG: pyruvate kinase [Trueperaceae bacterium]|nr:pyruvate kinase [Trueperaceae bacterium]
MAPGDLASLRVELDAVREQVVAQAEATLARWGADAVPEPRRASLRNLAHYLALRRYDLRDLQDRLSELGLSSLGRAEPRVLANLDAIRASLAAILGDARAAEARPDPAAMRAGSAHLDAALEALAGPARGERTTRILVTLDGRRDDLAAHVGRLLDAGTDLVRINAAHDDPTTWRGMVDVVRGEARARGAQVRILLDLPGAGLRTRMEQRTKRLRPGETVQLHRAPSKPRDVGVSVPEALDAIPVGATVAFDDGRVETRVRTRGPDALTLEVTHAREGGDRIRPNKSVGVRGVALPLPFPTDADRAALEALAGHVDVVGLSFVRSPDDVAWLQDATASWGADAPPALVAKIETGEAVAALPEILAQGLRGGAFGAMIARGDLAVDIGFERLAEIQEELLWVCEAAHVPVVWATQVLESLAKTGLPSRAEITDAAMADRAEVVLLNKGRYQERAVALLDDVLRRMERHAKKKNPRLRALASWPAWSAPPR